MSGQDEGTVNLSYHAGAQEAQGKALPPEKLWKDLPPGFQPEKEPANTVAAEAVTEQLREQAAERESFLEGLARKVMEERSPFDNVKVKHSALEEDILARIEALESSTKLQRGQIDLVEQCLTSIREAGAATAEVLDELVDSNEEQKLVHELMQDVDRLTQENKRLKDMLRAAIQ